MNDTGRPGIDRRTLLGTAAAAGAGALAWFATRSAAVGPPRPAARRAYVGGFTAGEYGLPGLPGIGLADVGADGSLRVHGYQQGIENPSYLTLGPGGDVLYAVSQTDDGHVHAFRVRGDGGLDPLNAVPTEGATPVHLAAHPDGRFLMTANYDSASVAVHALEEDGSIGALLDLVEHTGSGPDRVEQAAPHPHMCLFLPGTHDVVVPDKGNDHVYVYALDPRDGRLTERSRTLVAEGAGPRHAAPHPLGRHLYVSNELSSTLTVCEYDADEGALALGGSVPVASPGADPRNAPSGVLVSPDARFVYTADRGLDTVVSYAVTDEGAGLRLIESQPVTTKGPGTRWPRAIALDPSGAYLYAANQAGQSVTAYRVSEGGRLAPVGAPTPVASPSCVVLSER
ncbi:MULTISPECIES: lactonase family protein [unclassified Nocardiopsis]|uniref:lactonase family protein n=1 Tax=unclassified Nocardiopsis TaxID=2649073 RepID=UPI00135B66B3|nr:MULTISPECIES: lactonase family protein [unclassified Nocardiopsis]